MCPQELLCAITVTKPQQKKGSKSLGSVAGILLIFVFSLALAVVHAENRTEEYLSVKNYVLPANAYPLNQLMENGIITYSNGKAFSGIAFERYPNGRLLRVMDLKDGKKHGILLLWYPDGAAQMSANYREGILHGRFLGWYNNGSVIYDMMLNRGTYAGDSIMDDDDSRAGSDREDSDREGPDNDQSPE